MKLLLEISFLGTDFCGYQIQREGRTVQGELCTAAESLFGFPCDITGCSRTDSGVHAHSFYVSVTKRGSSKLETTIPIERIPLAFAAFLPPDISVRSAREVSEDFHPRYDVLYKEYKYLIYNSRTQDPFLEGRSWHYPRRIDDGALALMQEAAKRFIGRYDFAAYMAAGSDIADTVREIYGADVRREGDIITFTVSANGFLYNMVRILTGTLIGVADGKIRPEEIDEITASRDRKRAGITVPACGLYLNRVEYGE